MARPDTEQQIRLWDELELVQQTFPFSVEGLLLFAQVCLTSLIPSQPTLNPMQADILKYLFLGKKYRMVQAQRGQAKTTLAGIFCAFMLLHFPHYRIVIFSQTGKRAKEISGWVIKIFRGLDFLEFMLPNTQEGDKASVTDGFDINSVFKGQGKEPSVSCYSIESGAQGARADIILADDIESLQNSRTAGGRAWLEEQSKEFTSINQFGDIIYLGTPQSTDSIYNNLPSRGYEVRIWTGRFPTAEELPTYGEYLAPFIRDAILNDPSLQTGGGLTGKRGKPTCPEMYDEVLLQEKEQELGASKFDLQFMLNTRLSDAGRYPLKLCDLIVAPFTNKQGPVLPVWSDSLTCRVPNAPRIGNKASDYFTNLYPKTYEWRGWDYKLMYIDPAGGGKNGDETGYAVVYSLGNVLYLYSVGGVAGGYAPEGLKSLVAVAKEAGVHEVFIEENYGNGALMAMIRPYFEDATEGYACTLSNDYNTGQKEVRVIDSLEPFLSTHRMVVRDSLLKHDIDTVQKYPAEKRMTYSAFFQLSHINRDKGCLSHDDRVEAWANCVAKLALKVAFNQHRVDEAANAAARAEWLANQRDPMARRELMSRARLGYTPSRVTAMEHEENGTAISTRNWD